MSSCVDVKQNILNMEELEKPIGDFVIKNAKGTQTENGVYYHYSEVCTLLKKYKKQLLIHSVVDSNFRCVMNEEEDKDKCKVQCAWCECGG
jgi:hypothetical protein